MRDNRIVLVGIVVVLFISGVVIVFFGGQNSSDPQNVVSAPEIIINEATSPVVIEATSEVTETIAVTVQSELAIPTPRSGLEATDPSTVNLVSGNVQFVEAFAFW